MVSLRLHYILTFTFLISCSSLQQRRASDEISELYKKGDHKTLVEKITNKKLYEREQDRFLKQAELGTLFFRMGEYDQALASFKMARTIADELYTIRVSKKIKSFLLNDTEDNYYPNPYDLSMLRFYEILSVLKKIENEKSSSQKSMLESLSRDWQAYLDNLKDRKLGEAEYKGVVLADLVAYIIHNYLGRSSDISQAKSFKRIAKRDLKTKMGLYESFNNKYEKYREDFDKLHLKSNKEIFSKYIDKTDVYKGVEKFLTKKYDQVIVLLNGNIKSKTPKKYKFPIDLLGFAATNNISKGDFVSFSTRVLSLSSPTNPTLAFEVPAIKSSAKTKNSPYKILSEGKLVDDGFSTMVSHNSEVMKKLLAEESAASKVRLGTKLVTKHLTLLLASYATYRALREKQGELLAYMAATASYAVSNKAIEALELADLRSWGGLHEFVDFIPVSLKEGQYTIEYLGKKTKFMVTGARKQIIPLVL